MAEPTEAMRQHIAALRARRAGAGAGPAPRTGAAQVPAHASHGRPARAAAQAGAPEAGLPWSPPPRPGAPQPGGDMPAALSGIRVDPAAPAPVSASPATPAAVNLGPLAPLDAGAQRTDALLAPGDREADAAMRARQDAAAQDAAAQQQRAAAEAQQQASERRGRAAGQEVPDPGATRREPGTMEHVGAGLYHGVNRPFAALDRATMAFDDMAEPYVPGLAWANRQLGGTPERRNAHRAELNAEEEDYQRQHGDSRAARNGDLAGQVAVTAAATAATGGFAALPGAMAGRAALAQTGRAATGVLGQSGRTLAINGGVGCASGGISGGLSDGWAGAGIGCGVGTTTNILSPAAALRATNAVRVGQGGAFAQTATFAATYTAANAFGGGAAQLATNAAVGKPVWENVPRAALIGGLVPLATGDTAVSALTAAATRGRAHLQLPELGSYALTGQTGMFGIGATVATNGYDTRREGPATPGGSVDERRQQDAEHASRDSGTYIGSGAFLPVDGSGGT